MTRVDPGTEDAPEPLRSRDCNRNLIRLYASPQDPRWTVDVWLHANGDVAAVQSIRPRAAETHKITEVTPEPPHGDREAGLGALRRSQTAGNGNGGSA